MSRPPSQIPAANLREMCELLRATPPGITAELGVYKGGSAYALWEADPVRPIWLFDTFEGIPFKHDGDQFEVGAFSDTSAEDVQAALPAAKLFKGVFPGTFPCIHIEPIFSFVHVDGDQYQSTRDAIDAFWPRMNSGGVICFDDYPIEPVRRAIDETFGELLLFTPNRIPYVRKP